MPGRCCRAGSARPAPWPGDHGEVPLQRIDLALARAPFGGDRYFADARLERRSSLAPISSASMPRLFSSAILPFEELDVALALGQHQAAGDLDLEVLAGVALDLLPQRDRGRPERQVSAARLAGARRREVEGQQLDMQAARIGAGGLQVHVVALDDQRLDTLARQPVGERRSPRRRRRSPACRRLGRQRPGLARPRHVGRHEIGWPSIRLLDRERADRHRLAGGRGANRPNRRARPGTSARSSARNSGPGSGPCRPASRVSAPPACRDRRDQPRNSPAVTSSQRQTTALSSIAPASSGGASNSCQRAAGSARRRPASAAPSRGRRPSGRDRRRWPQRPARPAPRPPGRRRSARRRRWRRPRRGWCGHRRRSASPSSRCRAHEAMAHPSERANSDDEAKP